MQTKCYLTQGRCGERPLRGVAVCLAHVGRHLHRGQQQLRQRVPVPVQGDHCIIIIIIIIIIMIITIIIIIMTLGSLAHESRFWVLGVLGRVVLAPCFHVEFADLWLADQLNSLSQVRAVILSCVTM